MFKNEVSVEQVWGAAATALRLKDSGDWALARLFDTSRSGLPSLTILAEIIINEQLLNITIGDIQHGRKVRKHFEVLTFKALSNKPLTNYERRLAAAVALEDWSTSGTPAMFTAVCLSLRVHRVKTGEINV
jgi:hypothetical protein